MSYLKDLLAAIAKAASCCEIADASGLVYERYEFRR